MRTREEVVRLMGAKDREVDDVQETEDGTVVTVRGTRTLIREDGSMVHGVDEPEVEVVEELSEEDAERIAAHVNGVELVGDGTGEALPPIDEDDPSAECVHDPVPEGSIAAVLEWVGDDADKAARALDAELAKDAPRSTLVAALEKFAA